MGGYGNFRYPLLGRHATFDVCSCHTRTQACPRRTRGHCYARGLPACHSRGCPLRPVGGGELGPVGARQRSSGQRLLGVVGCDDGRRSTRWGARQQCCASAVKIYNTATLDRELRVASLIAAATSRHNGMSFQPTLTGTQHSKRKDCHVPPPVYFTVRGNYASPL